MRLKCGLTTLDDMVIFFGPRESNGKGGAVDGLTVPGYSFEAGKDYMTHCIFVRVSLFLSLSMLSASCVSTPDNAEPRNGLSGAEVAAAESNARGTPGSGPRYVSGAFGLPGQLLSGYPDWVGNPSIGGVSGAVGVATRNDLGTREQLDQARMNARLEIANTLEIRLQKVGRSELEQHVRIVGTTAGIGKDNDSRRSTIGVDRNITDIVLAGSRQRALWFNPVNGDAFVWMVLDGSIFQRVNHSVEHDVSVFVANAPITAEYRPQREPEVEIEVPPPAPEAPRGPIEQLESNLKPVETIPLKSADQPSKS